MFFSDTQDEKKLASIKIVKRSFLLLKNKFILITFYAKIIF
jgi:hypothetical protein